MVIVRPCPLVGAPVRQNMLNMPKSVSVSDTEPYTT